MSAAPPPSKLSARTIWEISVTPENTMSLLSHYFCLAYFLSIYDAPSRRLCA